MNLTCKGILVMPSNCSILENEEMEYIEGGFGVETAIALIIAAGGFSLTAGNNVGKAYCNKYGYKNWDRDKWIIRTVSIVYMGAIMGGLFIVGVNNGFYDQRYTRYKF